MPVFNYTARTLTGELQSGSIDLPSHEDVVAHLRKNRMIVVKVQQAPKDIKFDMFAKGVTTRDIVIFTRQFATMINSGLPLVQALDILAEQSENKALKDTTRAVVYDVESGHTLADALRKIAAGAVIPMRSANNATAHLWLNQPSRIEGEGMGSLEKLFSTHPPIEERIRRLQEM